MKWLKTVCVLLLLPLVLLVGCAEVESEVEVVTIRFATVGPHEHQYTIASRKFEELIEAKSGGEIEVELFPNAQLGGEREMAEGVRMGTIEMAIVTSDGALPAWVPETQIFSIPYLFRDREHVFSAVDGELGEVLGEKFLEQGFKHLGFVELGFRHFTNNKREIKVPDDMVGLKIRVQEAPIWFALIEAVGGIATPIPFPELYSAMQQGIVDGQENPIATIRTMKFYEVQKYLTLDAHTYAPGSVLVNPDFFEGLSENHQDLIIEVVREMEIYQRSYIAAGEELDLQYLKEQGMIVTVPDRDKFVEATRHIPYKEAVKKLVPPELVEMVRNVK